MRLNKRFTFLVCFLFSFTFFVSRLFSQDADLSKEILYIPVGDSYTIGEGVEKEKSWPELLVAHLRTDGVNIKLTANPAKTGFTAQDAMDKELPVFESSKPTFATLLIGVNDWAQGVDKETFRARFQILLDRMLAVLPQKNHLLVITLPDFSVTPRGKAFAVGRNISQGIAEFNSIIVEESKARGLSIVDIYPVSQEMKNDFSLISRDLLHPSAKEHVIWENLVYKEACKILENP